MEIITKEVEIRKVPIRINIGTVLIWSNMTQSIFQLPKTKIPLFRLEFFISKKKIKG